ncbi:transcriptional regulator (plasmid) [Cereibacter azotoformans]|uniref:transcriptional regulator n=1 Tax=Cereibacter azotoformans TaxID=43057 RepID=UPI003B227414
MSAIELNDLSLKELKSLQARIAKAIATHEDRRRRQALEELASRARQMGFTLAELVDGAPARKRSAAPARCQSSRSRGRPVRTGPEAAVILTAIATGKPPDDLRI